MNYILADLSLFNIDTDYHKLMTLFKEIGQDTFLPPYYSNGKIVVPMSEDFSFIFSEHGNFVGK